MTLAIPKQKLTHLLLGLSQLRVVALAVIPFLVAGCDVSRVWQEEVRLGDQSIVVVTRTSTRERIGELGASGYGRFKEEVLRIPNPNQAEWRGDISPIGVDVQGGAVFVVGWLRGWSACEKYGYPNPPFAYFRYTTSQGWEQIKPEEAPSTVRQNLLLEPWQPLVENLKGPLRLQSKEETNKSIYRTLPAIEDFHLQRGQIDDRDLLKCVPSKSLSNTSK